MTVEISKYWRLQKERYQLVGELCPHCNNKMFPPRDTCCECGKEAKVPYIFSGKGEVYSFTTISDPEYAPENFDLKTPYTIALIKLDEGPMVTAQLTDYGKEKPKIGDQVEMVTRVLFEQGKRGLIVYGCKFRPELVSPPTSGAR